MDAPRFNGDQEVATPRSYPGKRWDLIRQRQGEDDVPLPDRRDLEAEVVRILEYKGFYGELCSELADLTGVTKEWMRRVLHSMEKRELIGHRRVGVKTFLWYSREMWEKYHERWPQ